MPYSAGSIFLQVVPSFRGSEAAIAAEGRNLARGMSSSFDDEFEKSIGQSLPKAVEKASKQTQVSSRKAGKDSGDAYSGAFQESIKRGLASAQREIGTLKISADDKDLQKTLRAVKRDMSVLTDAKNEIGVDLNAGTAYKKLADLEKNLRELQDSSKDIDVRVNSAVAMATVEKLRADLMSLSAIQIEPEIKVDKQMGAFERSFKRAIQGAIDDIGTIEIDTDVNTTAGQKKLADLRRQLFDLSDKQIGVNISTFQAVSELERLHRELDIMSSGRWGIDVDANVFAAKAQLDSVLEALRKVDGSHARASVDVDGAAGAAAQLAAVSREANNADHAGGNAANSFRAFNGILFGVTTIGAAAVPILGSIAGALLAMGPLAVAGGAGLGVAALGLSGITTAVKALNAQHATATTQQQTYTRAVQTSAASVRDAEQSVQSARESAARSATSSERAVEQALQGVQDAERGVQDAQRARQQAQEDLTRAVKDATEQQQQLNFSLRDSQIGEQEAALNLREAQKALADGIAGGATGDALLELQLRVQRYQLTLDEAKDRTSDLQAETEQFAKTGVEGTDQVRAARQRLADSDRNIADAQRRVADAQAQVAQARTDQDQAAADSARQVRDAQERLTDAQTKYTEALSNVDAAQQKVNDSMKNLSPAGQDFANFIFGLKDEFQKFRYIAQEGLLPGLQGWMQTITGTYGPQLERTIFNLSSAVGGMFDKFGSALMSQPFRDLFNMIENDGPRFIGYMGDVLTNLGKGTASLLVAVEPLADFFGKLLVKGSQAFADWAAGLKGSTGLQNFFDYVEHITPKVIGFFQALWGAVVNLAKALAPYGEVLLDILTSVAGWIAKMDTGKLGAITVGIIVALGAMQGIFAISSGLQSIEEAWRGISKVFDGAVGKWAGFLGAAILLAGALFVLYQNSESFREVVNDLWNNVLEPLFSFIASTIMPILDGLASWFTTQPGLIAAVAGAFAGWKILTTVAGWLSGVRVEAEKLGTSLGKKVGGAAGAGLLGIIGTLGAGAVFSADAASNDMVGGVYQDLYGQLRQGGDTGQAQRLLNDRKNSFDWTDYAQALLPGSSPLEEFNSATDAYHKQWVEMSALEQAQSKVAEWTNTLAFRQSHLGETSDETAAAHRRLTYWTDQLDVEQHRLDEAATGVNTTLLEQQQLAIALADADIAYSQSMEDLDAAVQRRTDAQNAYNTAVQTYGANSAEAKQALDDLKASERDWTNQADATAKAAGAVAAARHTNADAATKESYSNAAILLDLERQKEKYGELPPRLEELRASLASTVDPAVLAAEKMEELGIKASSIPDSKTMKFDTAPSEEQIKLLEDLGFKVEHLPDGSVTATAETQSAEDALNQVARDRTSTVYQQVKLPQASTNPIAAATSLVGMIFGGNSATKKARGGPVWGAGTATSDSIPAYLSNGEFVVKAKAVSKYGLGFLHDVNSMRYADGGLVQGYADGGLVSNWGGTIDLKGGDVSPLATLWVQALIQINALSQVAATVIGDAFASMRDRVLSELTATKDGAASILGAQFATMMAATVAANGALYSEQLRYAGQWMALNAATGGALQSQYLQFYGNLLTLTMTADGALYSEQLRYAGQWMALVGVTNGALYNEQLRFAGQSMALTTATNSTLYGMYVQWGGNLLQFVMTLDSTLLTTWAQLSVNMINVTTGMINLIANQFDRLRTITAGPVNFVIVSVLNGGLFPALNSISSTFGLNQIVPAATPIKLATGGRVFGNSPTKTADNIPAWLTAGEYVHPVDSVDYYGADFMEMIRQRQIPREMLPGFASGGQATWTQLNALRAKMFPGSVMTSGYRPGSNDYHGAGMAIDIGWPGNAQSGLMPIAAALARAYPQSAEIIHNPNASVKNGRPVPSSFWGAATWAQHANHVHWAMTMAQLLMGANPSGYVAGSGGVSADEVFAQLANSVVGPVKQLTAQFGSNPFTAALAAVPAKLVVGIWDKIKGRVEESLAMSLSIDGSLDGAQTTGPVQDIVRSVAKQFGWDSGAEWNALSWIIQHESGWRPNAQNPNSTAYGLFQFLNGTWGSTGIAKTSDVAQQALAGMRYIGGRYHDPIGAQRFWQANGWYSSGGEVTPDGSAGSVTPELMDTGGWIHPGLNMIVNKTGRPEPVINPATLDALVSIGERGGAGVGDTFPIQSFNGATAPEIAAEILHQKTVASRGGKY